jgi:Fic-DOC domain mobile mystery protein B
VTGPLNEQAPDATPLTEEDLAGLRPAWITTRSELNQVEADNIFAGRIWAFRRRAVKFWYLQDGQLERIHKQMLGDVWTWAGAHRRRPTSVGIDPHRISVALRDLRDDTVAQIGDGVHLAYPADELAVRYHHRLVSIHPFPNGNGRHSRLITDLLVRDLGIDDFSWGASDLATAGDARSRYIAALRLADRESAFRGLLAFARS